MANSSGHEANSILMGYGNSVHDPAVAFAHGDLLFAEGLERSCQNKRAWGMFGLFFAARSLRKVLGVLGFPKSPTHIKIRSTWDYGLLASLIQLLFHAVLYRKHDAKLKFPKNCGYLHTFEKSTGELSIPLVSLSQFLITLTRPVFSYMAGRFLFDSVVPVSDVKTKHHLSHAANAVYTSAFEECAVMIVDGTGESESMSFYHFTGGKFIPIARNSQAQSLGGLYSAMTLVCGFSVVDGEEWKMMGLAAYGKHDNQIYSFFKSRTRIQGLKVNIDFDQRSMAELEKILKGFRRPSDKDTLRMADFAHTFQNYFADTLCEIASNFYKLGLSQNLAYAGGCALNSSCNGFIQRSSGFKSVHIPSAPGDDGNALGAVLYEKYQVQGHVRLLQKMSPYLGSPVDEERLTHILSFQGMHFRKFENQNELVAVTARLLSEGKIIGWMQGRAEFGPRALGNRSILADPRPADMKDRINKFVKFREEFRPLAPSILSEYGPEYFEDYQDSPYMERTLKFKEEVRGKVPAVVHLDGTGRLQSVSQTLNPLYHALISEFRRITEVPLVLNSSLNVMGKPIVHSVEDAITIFYTTGMHYMAIGNTLLSREPIVWSFY